MLIIMDQVPSEPLDPNYKPGYIPGESGVYDPYTGVTYSAYGLTDEEFQERTDAGYGLWARDSGVGDARRARMTA
jgi:hypothetical protein